MTESARIPNFSEFYPYYLSEHANVTCRRWHFFGTTGVILVAIYALLTATWAMLWCLPVLGYGCAWIGHYVFEKNRPATFTYPLWSLRGDFVMWWHILTGKIPL